MTMMLPPSSPERSNHLLPLLVPVEKLCRPFSLAEILSATHNFDCSSVIGTGGFGQVYKGVINNGANVVAIKRLKSTSKQGDSEFRTEIEMLSKFRHSHIVSLIGYCYSSAEMILIYEYMNNGSLADHLYKKRDNSGGCTLSWVQRLKICLGAARGLDYLHTGTVTVVEDGVIHRDVKSSNILLDRNWLAKVSDFGLSKNNPINQSYARTKVKGTLGYMDPEYAMTGRLRMTSDVYSFGVVLFEVLCGRRALDLSLSEERRKLIVWVSRCIEEGRLHQIIDHQLKWEVFPSSLSKFAGIAYQCLCYDWKKRPTMTQVVASLELALALQLRKKDSSWLEVEIFDNLEKADCLKEELMTIDTRFAKADRIFDNLEKADCLKEELMTIDTRFEKADRIFRQFDTNQDDCLNAVEVKALVIARNPGVIFTNRQISAFLDKFFQVYNLFMDGDKGLTYLGFLQMYDDGVGDVHRDFATLGFEL